MENLNAEQVKKALECCVTTSEGDCIACGYRGKKDGLFITCTNCLIADALALINSQEQRIAAQDMTISELRQRCEKAEHDASRYEQRIKELEAKNRQYDYEQRKLVEAHDTYKEYAEKMQLFVEKIKHREEEGYEPSAARYAAEMDMWRVVAIEKMRLTEENEYLRGRVIGKIELDISEIRADTAKKTLDAVRSRATRNAYSCMISGNIRETYTISGEALDKIEKELLESAK